MLKEVAKLNVTFPSMSSVVRLSVVLVLSGIWKPQIVVLLGRLLLDMIWLHVVVDDILAILLYGRNMVELRVVAIQIVVLLL